MAARQDSRDAERMDSLIAALGPVRLRTGPLLLRPWEPRDAPAVAAACSDPEVARWTLLPQPYTPDTARSWVGEEAPGQWSSGRGAQFGVFGLTSGALVGAVGLGHIDDGTAEVGYWTALEARGRGVATRAVTAACRWGFDELGLARIAWQALVGNWGSRAVAERCGFLLEGTRRAGLVQRGVRLDAWSGALLPGDGPPAALPVLVDGPVLLRPLTRGDVPALVDGVDGEALRWTGLADPFDDAAARLLVARGGPAVPATGSFAVVVQERLVGVASARVDERGVAVLGWWVAAAERGRGHGTRAVRLLLGWVAQQGPVRIEASVSPGNAASTRLAERVGLAAEGVRRQGVRQRGRPVDVVVHAMVPGDAAWPGDAGHRHRA